MSKRTFKAPINPFTSSGVYALSNIQDGDFIEDELSGELTAIKGDMKLILKEYIDAELIPVKNFSLIERCFSETTAQLFLYLGGKAREYPNYTVTNKEYASNFGYSNVTRAGTVLNKDSILLQSLIFTLENKHKANYETRISMFHKVEVNKKTGYTTFYFHDDFIAAVKKGRCYEQSTEVLEQRKGGFAIAYKRVQRETIKPQDGKKLLISTLLKESGLDIYDFVMEHRKKDVGRYIKTPFERFLDNHYLNWRYTQDGQTIDRAAAKRMRWQNYIKLFIEWD